MIVVKLVSVLIDLVVSLIVNAKFIRPLEFSMAHGTAIEDKRMIHPVALYDISLR